MSEKIQVRKIFDKQYTGAAAFGFTEAIDCFRTPHGVESFRIGMAARFSLGAGAVATMRSYAPALLARRVRLTGSREAANDTFVNTSALSLLWDVTTDYGLSFPEVVGPYGGTQTYVGPGTFDFGFTVKIDMAPPRMETDWRRRVWYPGNAYSALAMEIDVLPFTQLFYGAIPASLTPISSQIQVTQTQQPKSWATTNFRQPLFYYQRMLKDQIKVDAAGTVTSQAPLGGILNRITAITYDRNTVLPQDFLVSDVVVKEETSEMMHQPWGRFRSDNFDDFNIGNQQASYGRILIPFCRQGLIENALDMRTWGADGKSLTTEFTIPTAPVTGMGIDVHYNRFIGPYELPGPSNG